MCNILNALKIGSWEIPWTMEEALFWNLIAQVCLLLAVVIVFIIVIRRVLKDVAPQKIEFPKEERTLMGITLDASMVQRDFKVGDEFACDGLLVIANYNLAPASEVVGEFTVISQEMLKNEEALEALTECLVVAPDMTEPGKKTVNVSYRGQSTSFIISVTEVEEAEPVPEETEEPAEETAAEPARPVTVIATPAPVKRALVGISVDASLVRRDFYVGDEFECEGLIVMAHFNTAPYTVQASKFQIAPPDMMSSGKKAVLVRVDQEYALYGVNIMEPAQLPAEEPAPERELLSIALDTTVVQREFFVGDTFNSDGLIVTANYSGEPLSEQVTEYEIVAPDMSEEGKPTVTVKYGDKTAVYAISVAAVPAEEEPEEGPAPERILMSITLNTDAVQKEFTAGDSLSHEGLIVTANYSEEPYTEEVTDYTVLAPDMTKEGKPTVTVAYQDMMAGYQIVINAAPAEEEPEKEPEEEPEVIHIKPEPVIIEEESFEAGKLRYNKSFTARIIQSDDVVKNWYTQIKNELLSYKKAKARMSWKRENFRVGRLPFARFGFRGKTLCLFLPLNPLELEDTKYKVEDVSDNASFAETPCMFRIKNDRRVKYAMELIALVAAGIGAPRVEHESEDFYMPYEGVVELINKGLIKRNIKTKADEAIFTENRNAAEEGPKPTETEIAPGIIIRAVSEKSEEAEAEIAVAEDAEEPAPVEEAFDEPAPIVDEPMPIEDEPIVDEPAPIEEEPVVDEPAPIEEEPAPVEEEPVEEPMPIEDEPVEEPAPVEEEPVDEPMPIEDEPVEELAPIEEEPVEEPAPVEEEPVVDEPAPVEEEPVVDEPAPIEEEPVVDEPAPIEEEPVDEPAPIEEEPVVDEPAPIEEEPVVDEPAPIEEEPVDEPAPIEEEPVDEPAPFEEEPIVDEPTPVEEEPVVDEPAPVEEEPVVDEPAPIEEEPADEPVPIDEIFDETEEAAPMSENGSAGEDPNQGVSAKSSLSMRRRRNRHKHR